MAEVSALFTSLQKPLLCRDITLDCPSPAFPPPELITSARKVQIIPKRLVEDLKHCFLIHIPQVELKQFPAETSSIISVLLSVNLFPFFAHSCSILYRARFQKYYYQMMDCMKACIVNECKTLCARRMH